MSADSHATGPVTDRPADTGNAFARKVAGGAAITMGGQAGKVIVQFGGVILLARLLAPEDYGLLAMITAITGFGELLRDFGLSSAAIQAPTLSREQQDNLFWTNAAIGTLMAIVVFSLSWSIANFYDTPRLVLLTQVMSVNFIFNGLMTQYRADLVRRMQFARLSISDVGGQLLGLGAGVVAALAGWGYWALAAQQVVQSLMVLVLMVACGRWLPRLPHRHASIRGFVRFGWHMVGAQLLGYLGNNVGQVVIGHRLGAEPLGLFNRAFALLMMPLIQINAPASTVALPVLSRLQDDRERYVAFLLRGQTVMVHLVVSMFAVASGVSLPLIAVVLGRQWLEAAPVFQVLTIGGIFQVISYASYWVFISKGLTAAQLRYSMVSRTFHVACIVIGAHWGLIGVAAGYTIGIAAAWPLGLWWIGRVSDVPVRAMASVGLRATLGYGLCGFAGWAASEHWGGDGQYIFSLGAGLAAALLALVVVIAVWPRFRQDIVAILDSRSLLLRSKA